MINIMEHHPYIYVGRVNRLLDVHCWHHQRKVKQLDFCVKIISPYADMLCAPDGPR